MSRSIHTTRRHVERLKRERFGDAAVGRKAIADAEQELEAKRSVKRHRPAATLPGLVDADAIPIVAEPEISTLVHPASPDDVRALLRRLPRGTLDGLTEIRLCPGFQSVRDMGGDGDERDAIGRPVNERLPGVHVPLVLGEYLSGHRRIELFAYAVTDAENLALARPLVRAWGLTTLAHEIGHHHDFTARTKRDRWRADQSPAREHYAERMERAWGIEHVLAYVEEVYQREVAALHGWIEATLGVPLTLAELLGDPRSTTRTGLRRLQWSVHEAFASILRHSSDRDQSRIGAATDLLTAGECDKSLVVLDLVLGAHPSRPDVRALRADALQSAGREAEGLAEAEDVLRTAPTEPRALDVALRGLAWAGRWEDLLALAMRALEGPTLKRYDRTTRTLAKARALLELRRWRELDDTIHTFLSVETSRFARCRAEGLHAISLLRRGEARAALEAADDALVVVAQRTWWHNVFDAVRFEALHALGQGSEAKALRLPTRRALAQMRFEEWIVRLEVLGAWASRAS